MDKQAQFDQKESLGFPLLSDADRAVATQLGAGAGPSFLPNKRVTYRHRHRPHAARRHPHRVLHGGPRRQGPRDPQGAPNCLSHPVVAVTGAASGIGAACRTRLEATGHRVIGVDIHASDVVADLGTEAGRDEAIRVITEICGGSLAGIITCAGLAGSPNRPGSLVASVNYFGTVDLLVGLRPLLGRRRLGRGHQLELDHRSAGDSRTVGGRLLGP